MSSRPEKARGRSVSMKVTTPRKVSMPVFTKMAGGSLMLSRAACTSRGTWRSFESRRRARSVSGAKVKMACDARLAARVWP